MHAQGTARWQRTDSGMQISKPHPNRVVKNNKKKFLKSFIFPIYKTACARRRTWRSSQSWSARTRPRAATSIGPSSTPRSQWTFSALRCGTSSRASTAPLLSSSRSSRSSPRKKNPRTTSPGAVPEWRHQSCKEKYQR